MALGASDCPAPLVNVAKLLQKSFELVLTGAGTVDQYLPNAAKSVLTASSHELQFFLKLLPRADAPSAVVE